MKLFLIILFCLSVSANLAAQTPAPTGSQYQSPVSNRPESSPQPKPESSALLDSSFDKMPEILAERVRTVYTVRNLVVGSGLTSIALLAYIWMLVNRHFPLRDDSNVENVLNTFHRQALSELRLNSMFSLTAATLGTTIIFGGILLSLLGLTSAAMVTGAAGVITEGIGYLFFQQTRAIRERVEKIEDQLLQVRLNAKLDEKPPPKQLPVAL